MIHKLFKFLKLLFDLHFINSILILDNLKIILILINLYFFLIIYKIFQNLAQLKKHFIEKICHSFL